MLINVIQSIRVSLILSACIYNKLPLIHLGFARMLSLLTNNNKKIFAVVFQTPADILQTELGVRLFLQCPM